MKLTRCIKISILCCRQGSTENPGINQRALKHLFSEIEDRKDMWTYTVTVSSVEIYNEVLRYLPSCSPSLSMTGRKISQHLEAVICFIIHYSSLLFYICATILFYISKGGLKYMKSALS